MRVPGVCDRNLTSSSRTSAYTTDDIVALSEIVERHQRFYIVPSVLAEVCDLADKLNRKYRFVLFEHVREIAKAMRDRRTDSRMLLEHPAFTRLGFANVSVLDCSTNDILVVTNDAECAREAFALGGLVPNLNEIRTIRFEIDKFSSAWP